LCRHTSIGFDQPFGYLGVCISASKKHRKVASTGARLLAYSR
jgi:hypothetical protein